MKKAVLLAPYFLPRRRVGAWRPFKFAIHLREHGWDPHIITIKEASGQLTDKEKRLLSDISVFKIKSPFDFTESSGSSINSSKKKSSKHLFSPVFNWVDKNFPVDTWLPLFWFRKKVIINHIKEIKPDILWSTGDPWSSHWLADKIAQKTDLPWIADFRDPWTLGDVNLKQRSSFSLWQDKKAEQKVIECASAVTFTSKATEQLYSNSYSLLSSKTSTIYNCFDRKLYSENDQTSIYFERNKLHLLFFGKFRRLSPAKPIIDILEIHDRIFSNQIPILVHSFGSLSQQDEEFARNAGVLNCFKQHNPIPAEKAMSVLSKVDVLWLSTNTERKNIIPAKLWDYLAAQRPILSIAPNPEIATILTETRSGIQFLPYEKEKVANFLQKMVLAKQKSKPLPIEEEFNQEAIQKYEAGEATRQLASLFDQMIQ